ncbi:MAG: pyridoxamine 5'-phosphate oxidase [Acidimicrobiaceae bacterium]|jgi:PPOX class probable F420-dependent enzyme|nr:pyridoxamine 5'-phosphate oxidase [Acidimicrobiaceae bacterium]|tara:strand:- start:44004 stop:44468 length:465 start_codon:yes stop_codon:yes gene_type:complete
MSNRREMIRMTEEEALEFMESQKSLQVATINKDGTPHLSTLWFDLVDGEIVFETFTKSQKIKNLQRDNRISCLLEDGLVYEKLRGVQINGVAELVDSPNEIHQLAKGVMARNNPEIPIEALDEVAKAMSVKRTAVIVKATKIVSWDHQKLEGAY